jgi:hypothetical protein
MTPEQIRKKLEASGNAWIDICKAEALKKIERIFKDAEARRLSGIDQATFDGVMEDLIRSSLFGFQHMVLLTVCLKLRRHRRFGPTFDLRTRLGSTFRPGSQDVLERLIAAYPLPTFGRVCGWDGPNYQAWNQTLQETIALHGQRGDLADLQLALISRTVLLRFRDRPAFWKLKCRF